jgi:hypothetical protein
VCNTSLSIMENRITIGRKVFSLGPEVTISPLRLAVGTPNVARTVLKSPNRPTANLLSGRDHRHRRRVRHTCHGRPHHHPDECLRISMTL